MPVSTEFEPRVVCPRCRRPAIACYCDYLTRIATRTRVVILQHPRERDMAIGTARMANLCLPNSELLVGFDWEHSPSLNQELSDPSRQVALLYPGDHAQTLETAKFERPLTLVVVDGTWANTKKMVRKNPVLAELPRLAFQPSQPSEYRIRREPAPQCVSTIEALMYVLGVLEVDAEPFARLMLPFRRMVDIQLECKAQRGAPRSRYKTEKLTRASPIPAPLQTQLDRIVCVVGEANAWPCRDVEHRSAFPDELVQWVAYRPETGEQFNCLAAPRHPLSPSTASHVALDAAQLLAGAPLDALLQEWRSFVREDDVICTWGRYATALFARSGGYLPSELYDLRLVTKHLLKRNIGTLEDYYASIEQQPAPSLAEGRAGHRLGQLTRVFRHLSSGAGLTRAPP